MQRVKLIILNILLLSLAFVGCSKDNNALQQESELIINASIEQSAEPVKAVISGTRFKIGNTMGLFVYFSEYPNQLTEFNIFGDKYRNIRASLSGYGTWQYKFEGTNSNTFNKIYLLDPQIETFTKGLAIKGYVPYVVGSTSIDRIKFALGGNSADVQDLMWAEQNAIADHSNASIIPDGNAKTVELTYKHAYALLNLGFRCKYDGQAGAVTTMKVSSITLKKKDGGSTPLYVSGYFNALTGTFTNELYEPDDKKITVSYDKENYTFQYNASEYVYVPFLIVPLQEYMEDGDYILEFKFNNQTLTTEYQILRNDIKITENGNNQYSFKSGYTYTFNFTFNNYIQLDNVSVSSEWEKEEIPLPF